MSNYPPGVTGNEYEIAGPDFEEEDKNSHCPLCCGDLMIAGYRDRKWLSCVACDFTEDIDDTCGGCDRPGAYCICP